jgi:hypothetical protein
VTEDDNARAELLAALLAERFPTARPTPRPKWLPHLPPVHDLGATCGPLAESA